MFNDDWPDPVYLHDDVRAVVWRIFGHGSSPLKNYSSYELIERIVSKRCKSLSPEQQRSDIAEIQKWFNSDGEHHWLKRGKREIVADLILKGIKTVCAEAAVWAIGSIDVTLSARMMRTYWPPEKIEEFVVITLQTLEELRQKRAVIDSTCLAQFDYGKVEISEKSLQRNGRLQTFHNLDNCGLDLVLNGLPTAVGNLVELLVELCSTDFRALIEKLGHPVMQARATLHRAHVSLSSDHRETLNWIVEDSCDALVAMAIVHTLKTVNKLDRDIRIADRRSPPEHTWATELRPLEDDLDFAASRLLTDLVERLSHFDPLKSSRWMGELLSGAPSVLHSDRDHESPRRIKQIEEACTDSLARLVQESWSQDLVPALCAGLRLTPVKSWTRHLAEIAWKVRDRAPVQAIQIARVMLLEHEHQLVEYGEYKNLYFDWSRWNEQAWIRGLGAALALTLKGSGLPIWVFTQCQALPLTVWDAEEDIESFMAADRVAIHWFLVALFAIEWLRELGRPTDPAQVRVIVEAFWSHRRFTERYTYPPQGPTADELASRYAIEYGDSGDSWLLEKARDGKVGPLSLWALVDQRQIKMNREGRADPCYDDVFRTEFVERVSSSFEEVGRFGLEELRFWGLLWLALEATDQACQAAKAIVAVPRRRGDRIYRISALELFAFVASKKQIDPDSRIQMRLLYNELWPHYTHAIGEDRVQRDKIDKLLEEDSKPLL